MACFSTILTGALFILEIRATKLPDDNRFKMWWRKHIISPEPEEK
jgi:hypothetical protein